MIDRSAPSPADGLMAVPAPRGPFPASTVGPASPRRPHGADGPDGPAGPAGAPPADGPAARGRATRLDALTGLRAVAALVVVLHHAAPTLLRVPGSRAVTALGYLGVSLFFVLSGLVLAWSARPVRARHFWGRRFARVYPLHLAALLAVVPVLVARDQTPTAGSTLASLSLVQAWSTDRSVYYGLNAVSWSLSCEAFFYLLFPLLVLVLAAPAARAPGRLLAGLLLGNLGLVGLRVLLVDDPSVRYALGYVNPLARLPEFAVGVVVGLALRAGWRPRLPVGRVLAALLTLLVVLTVANELAGGAGGTGLETGPVLTDGLPRDLVAALVLPVVCALVTALALSGLASSGPGGAPAGRARAVRLLETAVLVRLGIWSYALYLTHFTLLRLLRPVAPDLPLAGRAGLLVLVVPVTIGVAALGHRFVERPAERVLRRRLGGDPVAPPAHDRAADGSPVPG